jgi:hypothetical protein
MTDDLTVHTSPNETFPETYHRDIERLYDRKIDLIDPTLIEIVGVENESFSLAAASYTFPKAHDMMAFQTKLRNKFLLKVLDIETIKSKRGEEACCQHLKIWREFDDGRNTISFHGQSREPKKQYEFPFQLFIPRITHPDGKTDSKLVEIRFIASPASEKHERNPSAESEESFSLRRPSTWTGRRNSSGSKVPLPGQNIASAMRMLLRLPRNFQISKKRL